MSTVAADPHFHHHEVGDYSGPVTRPDLSMKEAGSPSFVGHERSLGSHQADLFDQNTLLPYVYCFIKNFVGASGSNTVAIDNKIEQAMDLVKSHLMFAVREEVEVLKEKIAELMERITHLEHENTILKTNATPETLAQLANTSNPATNPT